MAWHGLTDAQWEKIRPHLPLVRRSPKGGRPRVDDRRCFRGDLVDSLDRCAVERIADRVWSPFDLLPPAPAVGGGREITFAVAGLSGRTARPTTGKAGRVLCGRELRSRKKRGSCGRENQAGQGDQVDGRGRWRWYSARSVPGLGIPGGGPASRIRTSHCRRPDERPAPAVPRAPDCGPRVRQQRGAGVVQEQRCAADHSLPGEQHPGDGPGWSTPPSLRTPLDH